MSSNPEQPTVANLTEPRDKVALQTSAGTMFVDMTEVARRIGDQLSKGDRFSIGGYRNSRGELVPDYDSIKIERRADGA